MAMHARPEGLDRYLASWVPGPVTVRDELPAAPAERLGALLDLPRPLPDGDLLPPMWHWLYFLEWPAQAELGADGHPGEGHFLPPLPDRRRMFAGGRAEWRAAPTLGVSASRVSTLHDVRVKQGSSGEMVFVTVRHEISQGAQVCVVEESDFVYRSGEDPRRQAMHAIDTEHAPAADASWQLARRPDPTLLFRFSALTANAHRIHYDAPYTEQVEGYPGLVVHGPLLVLLMLELVRRSAPERQLHSLTYRLRRPLFAGEQLLALGEPQPDDGAELRVATAREPRHATVEVRFLEGPEARRPQ
ncbi:MAG: hypothetical protein GEV07_18250 [Streptosporangiales bacterium]|nr:hypothetical protein [Streptosporangiales bacterium]